MAPYAASYPARASDGAGPVILTLGLGAGQDSEEHMMVIDSFEEEVVREVQHYRDHAPMDVDSLRPWEGGQEGDERASLTVVLDTNILLSHLALLRQLVAALASASPPDTTSACPTPFLSFIVPSIVILELDGLKSSTRTNSSASGHTPVSSLARAATNWLLDVLPVNRASSSTQSALPSPIRGQRARETLIPEGVDGRVSAEGSGGAGGNDSLILDAALYFAPESERVVLLSNDKNLRLRARNEGIEAVAVETSWRGEELLDALDGDWRSKVRLAVNLVAEQGSTGTRVRPRKQRTRSHSPEQPRRPSPALESSMHAPVLSANTPHTLPTPAPSPVAVPVPAQAPNSTAQSMDIDSAPSVPHPAAPTRPSAILDRINATFAQLIAKPLAKHLSSSAAFDSLPLAHYTEWTGYDTVRALRKNWHDGAVETMCRCGIERCRGGQGERKATRQLASVKGSLANLEQAWDPRGAVTAADGWSPTRWEVALDEVELVLTVMLLGLYGGAGVGAQELEASVGAVVARWREELAALGVGAGA